VKFHVKRDEGEQKKQNKTKTKQTIGQLDGTFRVLTWNFKRCLIQNEAQQQINNSKLT